MVRNSPEILDGLVEISEYYRLDYPWEATDIHEHDRLAAADKAKK
jgi:hypothetical protein